MQNKRGEHNRQVGTEQFDTTVGRQHTDPDRSAVRDGAFSVLIGFAARKSIDEGRPVRIPELSDLEPQVARRRVEAVG